MRSYTFLLTLLTLMSCFDQGDQINQSSIYLNEVKANFENVTTYEGFINVMKTDLDQIVITSSDTKEDQLSMKFQKALILDKIHGTEFIEPTINNGEVILLPDVAIIRSLENDDVVHLIVDSEIGAESLEKLKSFSSYRHIISEEYASFGVGLTDIRGSWDLPEEAVDLIKSKSAFETMMKYNEYTKESEMIPVISEN